MSETAKKDQLIPSIPDTFENVAKAVLNPPKNSKFSVLESNKSNRRTKRKKRDK